MSADTAVDGGYEAFCGAIADGEPFYLTCPDGHGSVPPRRVCPECGADALDHESLSATGTVEAHTVIQVATPAFADRVPYVTAIVDFGPISLTGIVDAEPAAVENGLTVGLDIETETKGPRPTLVFPPE